MASPAASGTAYNIVATQFFRLGEEGAWNYLEELDPNIAHYTDSGAAPAQQAGTGEVVMGICFAHDIMNLWMQVIRSNWLFQKKPVGKSEQLQ